MIALFWWCKVFVIGGAGLWLCLLLVQLWLRWGVRQMYAGPPWPGEPEERLLPVVLFRVSIAAGWTLVVMAALVGVGWGLCSAAVPTPSRREMGMMLLTTHGWWIALGVFTVCATRQCAHIWEDVNRRAAASSQWLHSQPPQAQQTSRALRSRQSPTRNAFHHTEGKP